MVEPYYCYSCGLITPGLISCANCGSKKVPKRIFIHTPVNLSRRERQVIIKALRNNHLGEENLIRKLTRVKRVFSTKEHI